MQAHLFYLNQSNYLQELISRDNLKTWHSGPLNNGNFASSSEATAMAAIYDSTWSGTVADADTGAGLRLYFGGPDGHVREIAFTLGESSWAAQTTFSKTNGNAGISATNSSNRQTGVPMLFVQDMDNNIRLWLWDVDAEVSDRSARSGNWSEGKLQKSYSKSTGML